MIKNRRKIYQESSAKPSGNELRNLPPIGIILPFNSEKGIFNQSHTNVQQVMTNLRNLFLTNKGERIMQPEFGTDLQYYLFEPITDEDTFREQILGEIRESLNTWMPYVSIQEVNMITNPKEDGRFAESNYAVVITINLFISGTNIYVPVAMGISEQGTLEIM